MMRTGHPVDRARRIKMGLAVGLLLFAAILRLVGLTRVPPGIEHDEVAEWLIARGILAGRHAVFFSEAYGQEPLYLYLQAISITFLGDNVFALRFTTFVVAMATLAACYRMTRRLFGPIAGLSTLALLAVAFWPTFFARVGLRGMTLPLTLSLAADFLFAGLRAPGINRWWVASGLCLGLSTYTYSAARAVPILLLGCAVYLALFARQQMRGRWRGFTLMVAVAVLVATPLTLYLLGHPRVQSRVEEVAGPLVALRHGDPSLVWAGVRATALMFSVRGDQVIYYNWPGRPVFAEPASAALFYIGVAVAVWRWRRPAYAFALIWLFTLLLPVVVTAQPPAFVRALGALPAIFAFPGLGTVALVEWSGRRVHSAQWRVWARLIAAVSWSVILALNLVLTARDYFVRWAAHPQTQFVWQTDLAAVAQALDADPQITDVTIAGLSNAAMDAPSLDLLLRRSDLRVRWVDTGSPLSTGGALVVPQDGGWLFVPSVVPLNPLLAERLATWGARRIEQERFTAFRLVTTWRAESSSLPPLKIFVHLIRHYPE